jgi:LysM repeat protein
MKSGVASNRTLQIIGLIVLGAVLIIGGGLLLRSCARGQLALPASEGLPTPAPVQPVPTATSPAPPPVVPTATSPVVPTATPVGPSAIATIVPSTGGGDTTIIPVPVGPGDDGAGSFEPEVDSVAPLPSSDAVVPIPVDGDEDSASSGSSGSGSSGAVSRARCGTRVVYIVRPGDNVFRIALRYRTTIQSIARLNGLNSAREIRSGQRLVVVVCGGVSRQSSGRTYIVRSGDNLFRIALRYGTSAQAIRNANGLHSNLIVPGQVLFIP